MSTFLGETPVATPNQNYNNSPNINNENDIYTEEAKMGRKIEFDRGNPLNFDYPSNKVQTIPYSASGFVLFVWNKVLSIPLNILLIILLFVYLIVYLIEMDSISHLNLTYSISFHLCIIFIEIIVTTVEYIKIYLNDLKINNQRALKYDLEERKFINDKWQNLNVGNIIKVNKNEVVPADMIILDSQNHNHECFCDYSSINGNFDNFDLKKACNDTKSPGIKQIKLNEYIKNIKGVLKYEEPNSNMHIFNGRLKLDSFPRASDIKDENFVMRGSTIKNSHWVYGLVVYTGMETKIMMTLRYTQSGFEANDGENPNDTDVLGSKLKKKSNQFGSVIIKSNRDIIKKTLKFLQYIIIGLYVALLLLLILIELHKSFLCYYSFKNKRGDDHYYLFFYSVDDPGDEKSSNKKTSPFFEMYLSSVQYLLTLHFILPFNWFGLMEIAYFILSYFIIWDSKVRLNKRDKTEIINSNCLADFGQVKHILTDKTGTLTKRKFHLKACSIRGKMYSFDNLEQKDENYVFKLKNNDLKNLEIYQEMHSNSKFSNSIKEFMEKLSLCHSVRVALDDDEKKLSKKESKKDEKNKVKNVPSNAKNQIVYASSFAEEKSMLKTFSKLGYKIEKTLNYSTRLNIDNETKEYQILGRNKFSEERKRMSLLVKNLNDNGSCLLCKANDLSIFKLIKKTSPQSENEINKTRLQIKEMTKFGFRYFIFCYKNLNEEETISFMTKYKSAENYVVKSEEHLRNLAIEYEVNMTFLGVLFFEEKMDRDLKFSISKLNNAGIKVWIVSGDKRENVLSVGKNLNLFNPKSILGDFSDKDKPEDLDIKMSMLLMQFLFPNDKINKMKTRKGVSVDNLSIKSSSKDLTILISGNCFSRICNDQRNYQSLATLLSYCTSLLAYQFSSNNKFVLCHMLRTFCSKNSKVLAIGDGFNDFTMLKEADLSVGIRSREILQVRNTCDVIVSRFSQIVDLILVHGTWNFWRLFRIAFFSFYANFLIIFPIFVHQNVDPIGAHFYFDNYGKLTLDILVINIFIIVVFIFDQPVERTLLSINSNIYKENFYDMTYIIFEFALEFIKAAADGLIAYFFLYETQPCLDIDGYTMDGSVLGNTMLMTSYAIILFKIYVLRLSTINMGQILSGVVCFGALAGLVFIDDDIRISVAQGFSYMPIALNSLNVITIAFLYEYIGYKITNYTGDPFLIKITKLFMKHIRENLFFKNYNLMFTSLAKEMPMLINKIDKISYPEVLEKIYKNNHTLDPALENMADVSNEEVAHLKIRKPFLRFFDKKLEMDYLKHTKFGVFKNYLTYLISLVVFWLTDLILEKLENQKITKFMKLGYLILGFVLLIPNFQEKFRKYYTFYLFFYLTIEIVCVYIEKKTDNDTKICIQTFFILSFPMYFSTLNMQIIILSSVYYLLGITPAFYLNEFGFKEKLDDKYFLYSNLPLIYHRQFYVYGLVFIMLIFSYNNDLMCRVEFLKYHKSKAELKKDNLIMANLIPEFVREKMRRGERGATSYKYEIVSIVFCDINDFDSLVAKLTPKDLISFLDELYSVMDQFCQLHGLQKIETVGKTYMAAGGIEDCEKNLDEETKNIHSAIRCFEFSLDILDLVQKMILTSGDKIQVKIGIHTGKVIPAVVGNHKPQFSLIGDTVNTTSRMCSNSHENCVCCSEFSYEEIKQKYKDFEQSTKEVKGKGMMNLYLYDPSKHKKNIFSQNIGRDAQGNMVAKSITKKIPVLVKQTSKSSKRESKGVIATTPINNNVYRNNNDNVSLFSKHSLIENSMLIVENSEDLINVNDSKGNILNDDEDDDQFGQPNYSNFGNYHNTYYEEKKEKKSIVEKKMNEYIDIKNDYFNNSTLFFNFKDKIIENGFNRFENNKFKQNEKESIMINATFLFLILMDIYLTSQYAIISDDPIAWIIAANAVLFIIHVGILYKTHSIMESIPHFMPYIQSLLLILYTIINTVAQNEISEEYLLTWVVEEIVTITVIGASGLIHYKLMSLNFLCYIIIFLANIFCNLKNHLIIKYNVFLILLVIFKQIFIILSYFNLTLNFLRNTIESKSLQDTEKMLFNLMPLHVVQNMKDDIPVADVLDNVTLLFADIVQYTNFGNAHQPVEVVKMLMELFKRFDNATRECNVYKVHTIGDCYVVMGFNGKVSMNERNYYEEAKNVCKMGEAMIKHIREVRKKVNFEALDMRIGIHTGPVIAGIIGSTVVRYDIFGSDVLIANKMESSGVPGRINISEETRRLLESKEMPYSLTLNKVVKIPSVGREISCYLIDNADADYDKKK